MSIKKQIHLCWLSGEEFPDSIKKCIESWKTIMPEYRITLWDKEKFLSEIQCTFALQALHHKKWAFAADYMRLYALYKYGGIYLDSDVLIYKKFDDLLDNDFFSGIEYFKPTEYIAIEAAVMGSIQYHPFLRDCLDLYDNLTFELEDGCLNETPITLRIAEIAQKYGFRYIPKLQHLTNGMTIYPPYYFTNKSGTIKDGQTYAIHLCEGSWKSEKPGYLLRGIQFIKRYWKNPKTAVTNLLSKLKNYFLR